MQIFFKLSKYRLAIFYQIQHDSLVSMTRNLNEDSSVSNMTSFKFLSLFNDFYDSFIQDIINLVKKIDYDQLCINLIKSSVYLFEKFFLIISSRYDSHLTSSYMKYWNFLHEQFKQIHALHPNVWSRDFESIHNLFNQSLFFDSSIFDMYRKLWITNRPEIYITNTNSLDLCRNFNNNLIHTSNLNIQLNIRNLIEKIQHLTKHKQLTDNLKDNLKLNKINDDTVKELKSIDCCNLNNFLKNIDSNFNQRNVYDSLNKIYIENQAVPFYYFIDFIKEFYSITRSNQSDSISSINNLNDLITNKMSFGKFSFLFNQMPNKLRNFFNAYEDLLICLLNNNKSDDDSNLTEYSDSEMRKNNLLNKLSRNFDAKKCVQSFKSILHFNWINEFISGIYFQDSIEADLNNNNKQAKKKLNNDSIKIELAFYDQKIAQLKNLNSFIWSNYSFLTEFKKFDNKLVDLLNIEILSVKKTCFDNNESIFNDYLVKKGFNQDLFNNFNKSNKFIEIIKAGCMISYLFSPVEPLDPFEYDLLVEKCRHDESYLTKNESNLIKFIKENKLKSVQYESICLDGKQHEKMDFYFMRENKSDYFFIKNEFENGLKQFCSDRLVKLIEKLFSSKSDEFLVEEEINNWILGLEKFTEKITNTFYSYADVVYLPVNGLSLVGYGMKALFTNWKTENSKRQNEKLTELVNFLFKYPYKEDHVEIANKMLHLSMDLEDKLNDELHLLSLMHLLNSLRYSTLKQTKINNQIRYEIFFKICVYFNNRYQAYKLAKEAENKVEDYKYKTYGQKETSQELEDKELADHFPSYVKYFDDFFRSELNDVKQKDNNEEQEIQTDESNKNLIEIDFLIKAFDLIEMFIDFQNQSFELNDSEFFDKNLLKTFYRSYSIASKLLLKHEINLDFNIEQSALHSHILYSSSINFDNLSFYIQDNSHTKYIYDFYNDPNQIQVIKCKQLLQKFYERIEFLLNEWENNPILIELIKIVKRIESFDLNDSLMKYLTGLELLVQKAQSWQLVESKMTSIENETKQISLIIIEWRKFELSFWSKSLDLELLNLRNKTAQNWFNHVFAICIEFQTGQVDHIEFLVTLKKFIEFSLIGEYFIRLKQLKLCHDIFIVDNKKENKLLTDSLWSVFNYYDTVYSGLIKENLNNEKQLIEKELKDFIDICRWQDMNYWALKQSVIKYNKGLFKIIKKFRHYLNQKIDFNTSKLTNSLTKHLSSLSLSSINLTISKKSIDDYFQSNESIDSEKYFDKMKIMCKKTLRKKCCKYNFNYVLANFSTQTYSVFYELNQTSNHLNQEYEKNKKEAKLKKDIKNVLTQKLKYISDLLKQLTHIGLSYRRGNMQISVKHQNLSQVLFFQPCIYSFKPNETISSYFNETNFAYYLCLDRFISFKSLLDTRVLDASKDSHLIPVEKFRGFSEHFFHLIHEQKEQLHAYLNDLFSFNMFKKTIDCLLDSILVSTQNEKNFTKTKSFIVKTFEMTKQIELFLKSVTQQEESTSGLIQSSYESIKDKLKKQNDCLFSNDVNKELSNFELLFPNEKTNNELINFRSKYDLNSEFNNNLNDLITLSDQNCAPFKSIFDEFLNEFKNLNQIVSINTQSNKNDLNLIEIEDISNKIKQSILKTMENIYKKYFKNNENVANNNLEEKSSLINESYHNFKEDIKLFNLFKLNELIKSCMNSIEKSNVTTINLSELKAIMSSMHAYCELFLNFVSKWTLYLIDNHFKSCKCFFTLITIFYELKSKGFSLPDDLNDTTNEEEGEAEEDNKPSNKFKTDDDDPKGLSSDAKGDKDVSDQIENEDQLDDAKLPEEREAEKNKEEEENEEPIEENENGIFL